MNTLETPFAQGPKSIQNPTEITRAPASTMEMGPIQIGGPDRGSQGGSAAPEGHGFSSDEVASLANELVGGTGPQPDQNQPQQNVSQQISDSADVELRRQLSELKTDDQVVKFLQNTYGQNNVFKNAEGQILFKKPGFDKPVKLDKSVSEFLSDVVNARFGAAAKELSGDIADVSVPSREFAGNLAGSVAGGGVGGLVAAAAGITAAPAIAGMVGLGAAAGVGLSAYYLYQKREEAISKMLQQKVDPKVVLDEAEKEALSAAGTELLFHGIGMLASKASGWIRSAIDEMPQNRAKSAVLLEKSLRDTEKVFGYSDSAASKEMIQSKVDSIKNFLTTQLSSFDKYALKENKPVNAENILRKYEEILSPYVKITGATEGNPMVTKTFDASAPFGDSAKGPGILDQLINEYVSLARYQHQVGGALPQEVFDMARSYGQLSRWDDETYKGPIKGIFRQLDRSYSQAKADHIKESLMRSEPGRLAEYQDAYSRFTKGIGDIEALRGDLLKPEASELVIDRLVQKNNPEDIRRIKRLFPNDDEILNQLKGSYLNRLMEKSLIKGPNGSIVLNTSKLWNEFQSTNSSVLKELFDNDEYKNIARLFLNGQKLATGDLVPSSEKAIIDSLTEAAVAPKMGISAFSLSRLIWSLLRQNPRAWHYLVENSFPEKVAVAQAGKNFQKADKLMEILQELVNLNMYSTETKFGNKNVLVPVPAFQVMFTQMSKPEQSARSNQAPAQKEEPVVGSE